MSGIEAGVQEIVRGINGAIVESHPDVECSGMVRVVPVNPNASRILVYWSSHEIVVSFGAESRVELGPADLGHLASVVGGIVAGGLVETLSVFGSSFRLDMGDSLITGSYHHIIPRRIRREMMEYAPY
ncbi:hypothetical protein GCM10027589_24220 [Actinocorallia lasiicapitis]